MARLTQTVFFVLMVADFTQGEVIRIAYIRLDEGENLEKAIKRFKRMVEKEGIIREWKKREYFEKPSTVKNRKQKSLQRKLMKKTRKLQTTKGY
jgi:small subunit ribosomal protein S21